MIMIGGYTMELYELNNRYINQSKRILDLWRSL